MYLNSVGSWSYVPKNACRSGLVQILQKEKTESECWMKSIQISLRPAGGVTAIFHTGISKYEPPISKCIYL